MPEFTECPNCKELSVRDGVCIDCGYKVPAKGKKGDKSTES